MEKVGIHNFTPATPLSLAHDTNYTLSEVVDCVCVLVWRRLELKGVIKLSD